MKQTLLQRKYPIYVLEIGRAETTLGSVDEICAFLRARIEDHGSAVFIAEFDHFAHTRSLPEGHVGEGIHAAKNVVFCFGFTLPEAEVLAVRPRSMGVAETDGGFVISFMEAPMPVANTAMERWASGIRDRVPEQESVREPLPA